MLQESAPLPHTWREFLWLSIGAILSFGGSFLPKLFRPRQSKAEEAKTEAEVRWGDVNATVAASSAVVSLLKEIGQATANVERLKVQKEFWEGKAAQLEVEKELIEKQLDELIRIGRPNNS